MTILDYSRSLNAAQEGTLQPALRTYESLQGLRFNEQDQQRQLQQDQAAQQAQQKDVAARQEGARLLTEGTPDEIASFGIKNPSVMKDFIQAANFKDQTAVGTRVKYAQDVLSGNVPPRQAIEARIQEVESGGGDATGLRQTLEIGTDEAITAAAAKDMAVIAPKMYESWSKATGKSGGPKLSAEAVAFNDLIKDFTPDEKKLARRVKTGLKGRAISNAVMTGIKEGTITEYKDALSEIKQATKFAEATGAQRAKLIDKGFEKITKIDAATRNMDKAIRVLKEGAGVGVFEKMWPSIKSSSVELDNIRGEMALDVVGAVTFGALSKGELDLAKDVALPTGKDTDELIDWLERKKIAQNKLRDYYSEQIQFLDQGGTVAGFLRMKEKGQAAPTDKAETQQIQEGQTASNAQGQTITFMNGQWVAQ